MFNYFQKLLLSRLSWWLSGIKNPPANAGDMGLVPGQGKTRIPHAWEQLSPDATTIKPVL